MTQNKNRTEIEYMFSCKDVWKDSKEEGPVKFHINREFSQ